MKKLNRLITEEFSFVRLYLDDFYKIIEELKCECESIEIEADNFSIEEPKEIEALDKLFVRELRIKTYKPSLEIDLRPYLACLRTYDNEAKAMGLFKKLTDILSKSQSPLRFFLKYWILLASGLTISSITICSSFFLKHIGTRALQKPMVYFIAVLLFLNFANLLLYVPTVYLMNTRRQSLFILQEKSNKQSFFTRKKDDLILAITTAVVGGFIGWLLGRYK